MKKRCPQRYEFEEESGWKFIIKNSIQETAKIRTMSLWDILFYHSSATSRRPDTHPKERKQKIAELISKKSISNETKG